MLPIIVLAIAIIALVILAFIEQDATRILKVAISTVFIFMLLAGIASLGSLMPADEIVSTKTTEISGITLEHMNYFYYLENGELQKLCDSRKAKLYEDEYKNSYITVTTRTSANPVLRFFFFTEKEEVEIHVPPGSITHRYN